VFIIIQLKHKFTRKRVTIVCVHLKAFQEFAEKRLEQTKFIMNILREHLVCNQEDISKQPVIMCGDFNGSLQEPFFNLILSQSDMRLSSVDFMNKKEQIDYIFYTKSNSSLELVSYLERVQVKETLPSLIYPSDHLSLVCDFQFV
jgi:endonuclease/exonuclease/phosphatase family metal-dependent hydrolase